MRLKQNEDYDFIKLRNRNKPFGHEKKIYHFYQKNNIVEMSTLKYYASINFILFSYIYDGKESKLGFY